MEVAWSQLREEARHLAQDIGQSGREHHSLANSRAVWDAIRAHGVPREHREWVWPILLHDQSMKLQRQQTEGGATYSQLLRGMTEELQEKAADPETSSSLDQAQEEAMERFHHLNPFQERKIRRILLAYAKSKDAFYYCHGMVESCVVLSTFLVEEDAFWSFRMLLEVLLPKYFDESVVDFHTDCLVLQELLRVHDPALSEHFAVLGVSIQLLCTKWFFSFFAESMPFEVVCRLYDIMFVDICSRQLGSKIIFSTSLAVLLYLSSTLVEIQGVNVVLEVINEFCWATLNEYSVAESFLDLINFMHEQIDDEELAALRQKYRAQLAQEEEQRKTMQQKVQTKKSSKKLKLDKQGSSEQQDQPRKGRIHSIKLLIQWRKHMIDNSDAPTNHARKRNCNNRVSKSDSSEIKRCGRNSRTRSREQESSFSSSDEETRGDDNGEAGLEIVTTPSEKEMLARVYQGISKINRRRSRTSSSMRSFSLRGADGALNSISSRSLSLSNSILSNTSSTKEGDDVSQPGDGEPEDEDALWERLRASGTPRTVVRHSKSGVPDAHRQWVWPILINQLPSPPDLPRNLAAVKNEDEEELLDREIAKSIENDITRTRNLRNDQVVPMRRVLTAFANRNRRVGYCQGMNEILVVLLQYLDEDQALRALILLIEVLLPAYHVDSMIGLHTDCAVMNTLLRQNDAELHAHLNELGLNMEILCTKWLVTCFLTSLPSFCGLKVLDMLMARSKEKQRASRVLLGVGISIFFTLRETLLDAKDAGEVLLAINEYFAREMTKTTIEMDKFLHFCLIITDQLEPDIVEEFRLVHKDEVMERFAAFEAKKIEMRQQLEEAKAKQRKVASAPPSPSKSDRLSTLSASGVISGKSNGHNRISGLSSYISNPLRGSGGSKTTTTGAGDDKESRKRYQRVDVLQTHHSFSEDLEKMEDQLGDLADLFLRGKIDEKEHSCIRAQIVRKWCKGMNSPQSAMVRVQCVKHTYYERSGGEGFTNSAPGLLEGPVRSSFTGEADGAHRGRKGSISLYGRMKKAQKSALAIFKSTFE
ncbi:TBC1 domain member 9 [Phytophthora pseudosyringae]|uniref:TBC1 domain member 9 n=1 Tax=Phytophthora pseudosyringae TaxID=221518 RepID=A0A8T1V900_9STRA|nr:TBC1 domain member 9 [Phytophthora pseudosyringae]